LRTGYVKTFNTFRILGLPESPQEVVVSTYRYLSRSFWGFDCPY